MPDLKGSPLFAVATSSAARAAARHGYITPANKEVKTLLSGNSNAQHGKRGGTTAKRSPSLHAKTFLK